jgi:peptidyl-prolyl cis-trans isomerase D
MFTWMRTHQRKLMLIITVLTIIAFAFLYNYTDPSKVRTDRLAQVYGRDLSITDFQREARKFNLAIALGLTEYASSLGATGSDEGLPDFVINKRIIDHEGRALGIQPTQKEIEAAIAALPVFQTGGQFDYEGKYKPLVATALAPQGFTELEIQELVRSSLILQRIKATLDAAPAVTEGEIAYLTRLFQPVTGVAIQFNLADFASQVKLTEDQINTAFKAGAARFVTPELRTARYVQFPLPAASEKLTGKAKIDAEQKVADAADAFATAAARVGFDKAAKDAGLKVETTLPFDRSGQMPALKELGDLSNVSVAGPLAAIAPAVFTLTKDAPITGVHQSGDQFVVAELKDVTPSRAMTLAEARPDITRELTDDAARAELTKAATAAIAKLRDAAKAGQTPAAATAGMKTQAFTNVSRMDDKAPMEQRQYADSAVVLNEGEVGGFQPGPTGGTVIWLEKRAPADEKVLAEHRAELTTGILTQRQNVLWAEWLKAAQKQAGAPFFTAKRG